mmetsp:Transcript_21617/g.88177  ORF Transcript_21617/g.88177 Transcript_21617/m.88177 type:complete len:200 (-) Transcript_21617:639-1238(-)
MDVENSSKAPRNDLAMTSATPARSFTLPPKASAADSPPTAVCTRIFNLSSLGCGIEYPANSTPGLLASIYLTAFPIVWSSPLKTIVAHDGSSPATSQVRSSPPVLAITIPNLPNYLTPYTKLISKLDFFSPHLTSSIDKTTSKARPISTFTLVMPSCFKSLSLCSASSTIVSSSIGGRVVGRGWRGLEKRVRTGAKGGP